MKRVILIVGALLAVALVVGPLVIGNVGRDNIEKQLAYVTDANPAITVVTESHEAGWFTGSSKHRIVLTDAGAVAGLEALLGDGRFGDQPALVVSSRLDNGPVAFSSLGREGGSLAPALNRSISTIELDLGNGETIALPGRVLSSVGFDGTNRGQVLVESGSYEFPDDNATMNWDGADISTEMSSGGRRIAAGGMIKPFSLSSPDGSVSVSAIEIETEQNKTRYDGIWVGNLAYAMESIEIGNTPAGNLSMQGLNVKANSDIDDNYISGSGKFSIADIDGPGFADIAVDMSVNIKDWDAASLQELTRIMREMQDAADPAAQQQYLPEVLASVQQLANGGAQMTFDKIHVAIPQGEVNGTIDLRFDKSSDAAQEFSPAALLQALHGDLLLEVPEELLNDAMAAQEGNPMFGMALAYLEKDGDIYRLKASYENGLLSVNGMPLPVPMPQ